MLLVLAVTVLFNFRLAPTRRLYIHNYYTIKVRNGWDSDSIPVVGDDDERDVSRNEV